MQGFYCEYVCFSEFIYEFPYKSQCSDLLGFRRTI